MSKTDARDKLKENPFSYRITKAGKTLIYYSNRQIMTLSIKDTNKLQLRIAGRSDFDIQLYLAKITGHFKHV